MQLGKIEYFEKFFKLLANPKRPEYTGEDCWNDLELWHEKRTGERKYKTYQVFRNEKSKYIAWERHNRRK